MTILVFGVKYSSSTDHCDTENEANHDPYYAFVSWAHGTSSGALRDLRRRQLKYNCMIKRLKRVRLLANDSAEQWLSLGCYNVAFRIKGIYAYKNTPPCFCYFFVTATPLPLRKLRSQQKRIFMQKQANTAVRLGEHRLKSKFWLCCKQEILYFSHFFAKRQHYYLKHKVPRTCMHQCLRVRARVCERREGVRKHKYTSLHGLHDI